MLKIGERERKLILGIEKLLKEEKEYFSGIFHGLETAIANIDKDSKEAKILLKMQSKIFGVIEFINSIKFEIEGENLKYFGFSNFSFLELDVEKANLKSFSCSLCILDERLSFTLKDLEEFNSINLKKLKVKFHNLIIEYAFDGDLQMVK